MSKKDHTMDLMALEIKAIVEKTPRFVEECRSFVQNPDAGVPWLRIDTLRMAAQGLEADYQRIDGLLAILEQRDAGAPAEKPEPRQETISAARFFEEVFDGIQQQYGGDHEQPGD